MVHAIRIHQHGGPEVLKWEEIDFGRPGPGEVLLRQTAVGLNFIDIYHRTGLYPLPLPLIPGSEAVGVVEAVGEGVADFKPGDRAAYAGPIGAYCEQRLAPAERLVHVPDGISDEVAATALLKGMTARYLLRQTFPVQAGQTILVHAAAGGVGLILCQWARALGVTVIGTVSSPEKAALAEANGCTHALTLEGPDLVARVKDLTGGHGVPVVYDSIGAAAFATSLDCLARRGMLVSFGNSSGAVPPIEPNLLARKGSLFLTRPTLFDYIASRQELTDAAEDLFQQILTGVVTLHIGQRYALKDAARAQQDLAARKTTGSTVLTV